MVKNIGSIIKIIILMIIILITFSPISRAFSLDSIMNDGFFFLEDGRNNQIVKDENGDIIYDENGNAVHVLDSEQLQTEINSVFNVVYTIGVALSVLVGAILGIKFMTGSVEEQAKIKETLIPYILGCVVVFGAFGIWKMVITISANIFN